MTDGDDAKLRRAMRQAAERGAAPVVPPRVPEPDPPDAGTAVAQSEAVDGATVQGDSRGAHAFTLAPRKPKKDEPAPPATPPDPDGRGGEVDLQA
jgi:hypothetical protein